MSVEEATAKGEELGRAALRGYALQQLGSILEGGTTCWKCGQPLPEDLAVDEDDWGWAQCPHCGADLAKL